MDDVIAHLTLEENWMASCDTEHRQATFPRYKLYSLVQSIKMPENSVESIGHSALEEKWMTSCDIEHRQATFQAYLQDMRAFVESIEMPER